MWFNQGIIQIFSYGRLFHWVVCENFPIILDFLHLVMHYVCVLYAKMYISNIIQLIKGMFSGASKTIHH